MTGTSIVNSLVYYQMVTDFRVITLYSMTKYLNIITSKSDENKRDDEMR